MSMLDNYQVETLVRLARARRTPDYAHVLAHNRRKVSLARRLARLAGRALLPVANGLLAYGGERARRAPADLVPYIASPSSSPN